MRAMNAIHTSVQSVSKNCVCSFLQSIAKQRNRKAKAQLTVVFQSVSLKTLEIHVMKESTILSNTGRRETHIPLAFCPRKVTRLGGDAIFLGDPAG